MTRTRRSALTPWIGFVGAALVILPGAARAQPADLFYERTVMNAADERCGLFTPQVSAALAAAAAQARGAALRAGHDPRDLDVLKRTAYRRAAAADCASEDVTRPAQRVRLPFAGYQKILRMNYPGDASMWSADRGVGRTARWRLAQSADFGSNRMIFGLAGNQGPSALVAVADFADNATPYSARLIFRDHSRTSGPYVTGAVRQPLASKLPPRSATRMYMAEARGAAEAELLPKGSGEAWAFRFPTAAVEALGQLDPREAVAIEFMFSGDRVRTAYVEVGDFAAGRAFLQYAAR